jgi:hypothetical protein
MTRPSIHETWLFRDDRDAANEALRKWVADYSGLGADGPPEAAGLLARLRRAAAIVQAERQLAGGGYRRMVSEAELADDVPDPAAAAALVDAGFIEPVTVTGRVRTERCYPWLGGDSQFVWAVAVEGLHAALELEAIRRLWTADRYNATARAWQAAVEALTRLAPGVTTGRVEIADDAADVLKRLGAVRAVRGRPGVYEAAAAPDDLRRLLADARAALRLATAIARRDIRGTVESVADMIATKGERDA